MSGLTYRNGGDLWFFARLTIIAVSGFSVQRFPRTMCGDLRLALKTFARSPYEAILGQPLSVAFLSIFA